MRVSVVTLTSLLEGLTKKEKGQVDGWLDSIGPHPLHPGHSSLHAGHLHTDHVFKGDDPHRVVIPLQAGKRESKVKDQLTSHLKSHGYDIDDYTKGLAKKGNRTSKIGKLLSKGKAAHPELHKMFSEDPVRGDSSTDDRQIVISRHPHDVAGMSACDHPWKSCLNFKSGDEKHHLYHEVKQGTMVAYMTHKGDDKAEKPVGRIAIRPHVDDNGHRIYRGERSVYGKTAQGDFEHTVTKWANSKFPAKPNSFYSRASTTYHEYPGPARIHTMGPVELTKLDHEGIHSYISSTAPDHMPKDHFHHILNHGSGEHVDSLVSLHKGKHVVDGLGTVAHRSPSSYLSSTPFDIHHTHTYSHPDKGHEMSMDGRDLIHKAPASHARAAIPGIDDHIKKVASSFSSLAHSQLLRAADQNKDGIVAHHRDSIHMGILNKPVTKSDAFHALSNVSDVLKDKNTSAAAVDHTFEKVDRAMSTYKTGKARTNWVHHVAEANRIGQDHESHEEAKSILDSLSKRAKNNSSHKAILNKLKGTK